MWTSYLCRRTYPQHTRMRLLTIALSFVPIPLVVLPVFASFHPPSGSLALPSKIVTSSDGLQIFTESAGRKGAPAGKSPSVSWLCGQFLMQQRCEVIFLHGIGCTSASFDPLFADPDLTSDLFMVSRLTLSFYQLSNNTLGV